jgi:proline iminopeptidase
MEAVRRWGEYEEEVMQAMIGVPASSPPPIGQWLIKYRLQSHDLSHGSFTSERSLFRHSRLAVRVPTVLLHGTHDWVCPLRKRKPPAGFMPHVELRWIRNGTHTASDPEICAALRQAVQDLAATSRLQNDPIIQRLPLPARRLQPSSAIKLAKTHFI